MSRYFTPIPREEFEDKVVKGYLAEDCAYQTLINDLGKDIKVKFDLENVSETDGEFGPEGLMGLVTLENGLTFYGFAAGGDWEHPVFWIVYWDGKRLRGYVPTEGNPWNRKTKMAHGNGEDDDDEPDNYSFDPDLIRKDIIARIQPIESKSAAPKEPEMGKMVFKISGYELRMALQRWVMRRENLLRRFNESLFAFAGEKKESSEELSQSLQDANANWSKLKTIQQWYNQTNIVSLGQDRMSLTQAVQMLPGAGQIEKLWRGAAEGEGQGRYLRTTRNKDEEHATRTVPVDRAMALAEKYADLANQLRKIVSIANATELECPLIESKDDYDRLFSLIEDKKP